MVENIEISVQDLGDNVTINIYELGAGGTTILLDDIVLKVDRGNTNPDDPISDETIIYLPLVWVGKRIRVARNGFYFKDYNRLTNGIELSQVGDLTQVDEEFAFSNY